MKSLFGRNGPPEIDRRGYSRAHRFMRRSSHEYSDKKEEEEEEEGEKLSNTRDSRAGSIDFEAVIGAYPHRSYSPT